MGARFESGTGESPGWAATAANGLMFSVPESDGALCERAEGENFSAPPRGESPPKETSRRAGRSWEHVEVASTHSRLGLDLRVWGIRGGPARELHALVAHACTFCTNGELARFVL